ncbi:hypothetical protein [Actinokineospora globicatena]|uniref:DUF2335 domain-containing protein n=1 Tax=Actinokineospora globicatena TaxID=103729 RepID=A0A9W6QUJ0_9PSEU|nr:hypothetical protein [Actinokineospora globicatena]GLW95293.1 hypothetical protein Aglo03_61090 [Actinokineospora globicatena]
MTLIDPTARDSPPEHPGTHSDCATTHRLVRALLERPYPTLAQSDQEFLRRVAEVVERQAAAVERHTERRAERTDFAITVLTMSAVMAGILLLYWAVAPEVLPPVALALAAAFIAAFTAQFRKRPNP